MCRRWMSNTDFLIFMGGLVHHHYTIAPSWVKLLDWGKVVSALRLVLTKSARAIARARGQISIFTTSLEPMTFIYNISNLLFLYSQFGMKCAYCFSNCKYSSFKITFSCLSLCSFLNFSSRILEYSHQKFLTSM